VREAATKVKDVCIVVTKGEFGVRSGLFWITTAFTLLLFSIFILQFVLGVEKSDGGTGVKLPKGIIEIYLTFLSLYVMAKEMETFLEVSELPANGDGRKNIVNLYRKRRGEMAVLAWVGFIILLAALDAFTDIGNEKDREQVLNSVTPIVLTAGALWAGSNRIGMMVKVASKIRKLWRDELSKNDS